MDKTRAVAGVAATFAALTLWAGPVAAQTGTDCSTCDSRTSSGGGGGGSDIGNIEIDDEPRGSVGNSGAENEEPSSGGASGPATGELPEEESSQAPAQAEAPAPAATETGGGGLPVTGGDVVGLAAFGATAIALGTVLTRRAKRPTVSTP